MPLRKRIEPPYYKVVEGVKKYTYKALLTQSGTNAPIAEVLENTLGNIVWNYETTGVYSGNLVNGFPVEKTSLNIQLQSKNSTSIIYYGDENTIFVETIGETSVNGILDKTAVEIIKYENI